MMSISFCVSFAIIFIAAFYIQPSAEYGFYQPSRSPYNESSATLGVNIIGQRVFTTTKRNGWAHLEIFDIVGSGSESSLSRIEDTDLGLNITEENIYYSSASNNLLVIGYSTLTTNTFIYEKNPTTGQWEQVAYFPVVSRLAKIISDTKIIYWVSLNWKNTANSIGCYVKQNGTWIMEEIASFIARDVNYYNGTLIASKADDLTLRIYEEVNGNFVEVQQTLVNGSSTLDQWGTRLFFLNENEFFFGNPNLGFPGAPMYLHRFVRQDNGTWADVAVIESQYVFDSPVAILGELIVSSGSFLAGTLGPQQIFIANMKTFDGTNALPSTSVSYSQGLPLDGALDATDGYHFTVLDSDKQLFLFGVNLLCANGFKEDNEQCDLGSYCSVFCECTSNFTRSIDPTILNCVPSCGNGYLDTNEECDAYFIDTCRSDCTCQSGYESTGSTTCRLICGNGVINQGEVCDPGIDDNCDKSCLACKSGYKLVTRTCIADEIQSPSDQSVALPAYLIPVAVIVPTVVIAGVIALIVVLVKKRNAQRKKDEEEFTTLSDSKYISISTTNSPNNSNGSKTNFSNVSDSNLDIPYKDLVLKQEIGAGAFGKVFLGEWQKVNVALKFSSVGRTEEFQKEAKLMIDLRSHPNVVQVLGLSLDGPFPILILEYCDGGSLESVIKRAPLSEDQLIDYAFGIARGMLHLHLNNIVHRDLAARNVLINDGVPKISDFGMARFVEEYKEGKTGSTVGPLNWMAPESLLHQTYSVKSDMWSFGCVLYELVTGKELYENIQAMDVYHGVTRGHLHPDTPDTAPRVIKVIMTKCFEFDPDKRPTFEEVCNWLREPSQFEAQNQLAQSSSQASPSENSQSNESS